MFPRLLQYLTNSQCLILDQRIGNWHDLKYSFMRQGINLQRFLVGDGHLKELYQYDHIDVKTLPPIYEDSINYETWYKSPNPYNAWLSHQKILRKTLMEGFQYVFMVEDDVIIEDDFGEILSKIEPFFDEHKWDAIYFGAYHNPTSWEPTSNENVIKVKGSGGLHACLLSEPLIQELIQLRPTGPIDWQLGQYFHNKYDCYAVYPSIISQSSGYSFVENSNLEKPSRYAR